MKNVWSRSCMRGSLRHQAKCLACGGAEVVGQAEEAPDAAFKTADQAGILESGEVVTDGRLTEVESGGEIAHANGLIGSFEHMQHLEAGWVGERFEEGGEILRLVGRQGLGDGNTAAFDAIGDDL